MSACQNNPRATAPTLAPPAIAPGSIKLTVQIDECVKRDGQVRSAVFDCEATVRSVQEYGAGTTQLPETTKIRISFRESLLTDGPELLLKSGNELALMIRTTRNTNAANTDPVWDTVLIF